MPNDPKDGVDVPAWESSAVYDFGDNGNVFTDGNFLAMSVSALQGFRPDLTREKLAQEGIVQGRDFIVIFNGSIMRGIIA